MGYDSVLKCSVWEYRDGYRDQILVHAYRIVDCDFFVRVRIVTFLFGMGVEWLGEKYAYFVLNVRSSG